MQQIQTPLGMMKVERLQDRKVHSCAFPCGEHHLGFCHAQWGFQVGESK